MDINTIYGLKPMTLEEEANAPENIKRLRQSKIKIHDECWFIIKMADQIMGRTREVLEKDDDAYVGLINKYQKLVGDATDLLYKAMMLGKE